MWKGSKRQARFLEMYRAARKEYVIYLLHVPSDSILKVGRTGRMAFRARNLRAGLYKPHTIHVIRCSSAEESLELDRFLKKALSVKHVIGEWFSTSPEHVLDVLDKSLAFNHLTFSTAEDDTPPLFKPDLRPRSPNFNIQID